MTGIDRAALAAGAAAIGVSLAPEQLDRFERYGALLAEWNEKINLTRIPHDQIVPLQFLDSLMLHHAYPLTTTKRLIDVGTGAGFPGIPIAIAFPEIAVTLLDSTRKKLDFISIVIRELRLENAVVLHARAEEAAHDRTLRESFDCAAARAVAALDVLSEWLLPFVRVGGAAVALKGDHIDQEIESGRQAAGEFGGRITPIRTAPIPNHPIVRSFAVIEKAKPTPPQFPRPATKARKKKR